MHKLLGKFADPPLYEFNDDALFQNQNPLPPIVWYPNDPVPVKDPFYDPTGGGIRIVPEPTFRAYFYTGVVRDAYSENPLPGATVSLVKGGRVVQNQVADRNGSFAIDSMDAVDFITITEVSHKPFTWPASEVQHTFDLEPDEKQIDPVILPPGKRKNYDWLVLLGIAAAVAKHQKWI